jgi:hypothetical protein
VPRRKRPPLPRAKAPLHEVEALRPVIEEIVRTRDRFAKLEVEPRSGLVDDLVDAVGFAKADLADILAGKQAKPAAWTMDIFVRDVCDALRRAGIEALMDPDPEASHAQSLARAVADAAGLPDQGALFHQMQRARKIVKTRLPDIRLEVTVLWAEPEEDCAKQD